VALALPAAFPLATLAANVAGTFLLGVVLYGARLWDLLRPELRLFAATGFCSSFTTYSTFAAETAALAPPLAALNVALSYALGFAAVLAGRAVARRLGRWAG
jgi:CrcB protein